MGRKRRSKDRIPDDPLSFQIKPSPCTTCGAVMDGATQLNVASPKPTPGDLTFCIQCGSWNQWDEEMIQRVPDEKALAWIAASPVARSISFSWVMAELDRRLQKMLNEAVKDYTDDSPAG